MRINQLKYLLLLILLSSSIQAEEFSAARVLDGCRALDTDAPYDSLQTYCLGIISGITMGAYISEREGHPGMICVPGDGTDIQMIRVVVKWIEEHPNIQHVSFTMAAHHALRNAFPCEHTEEQRT
jgi:hypothetical protein